MASSPDWGNPSPGSSKRGISTLKLLPSSQAVGQEKRNSRGKRKPCFKANRPQARTPTFPVLQDSQTPSLPRKTGKKRKKSPCHPLTCPSGKSGKSHLCKRSNREQQNPPAYPQDTLKSGISQASEDSPEETHLQEECRAVQQRCLQQEKGIICTKGGAWAPHVEITTLQSQAKAGQRTSQVHSSFDGSMFLGCKLTGHGRDLFPDFGNRLRLWYKNNI